MEGSNTTYVKGSYHLLREAVRKLRDMGYIHLRSLGDIKYGAFCFEYPKFFLTANGYLFRGNILSSQIDIIDRARAYKKDIVVYLAQTGRFYIFNPEDIHENHFENKREYWYKKKKIELIQI